MNKDYYRDLDIANRLPEIENYYRDGYSNADIAIWLGISIRTYATWLSLGRPDENGNCKNKKYAPLFEARKRGLTNNIAKLEGTAMLLALGEFKHKRTVTWVDDEGELQVREVEETLKPNAATLQFLLKSLKPNKYGGIFNPLFTGASECYTESDLSDIDDETLQSVKKMAQTILDSANSKTDK